uniref:Putative Argonaute-2 n=1 Tax=Daphnia magna TaxID=35525 RepID=A0A0P5E0J0_9CRUS
MNQILNRLLLHVFLGVLFAKLPAIIARSYKAAVIEYSPTGSVFSQTPTEVLGQNLNNYNQLIAEAASLGADIIVFPEYGLTTLSLSSLSRLAARPFLQQFPSINTSVPQLSCDGNKTVPDNEIVFTGLSCYARRNAIYVVANVGEIVMCPSGQNTTENGVCPEDGAFQYSSNVVFDRNGVLIARYRKTHLFLEPLFQSPIITDLTVFPTDFGVNFGLMTCFDIMFYEPALSLYYQQGIRNFIFPTAWVDELPFLTAIQKQEAWARFLGATLLASNYHLPANGQIGSGIYDAAGAISYISSPDSGTRIIAAQVGNKEDSPRGEVCPKEILQNSTARWMEPHGMLYEDLTNYSSMELTAGVAQTAFLCHDDLCCQLNYSISCPSNEICDQYRLFTYSGFRTLGGGVYTVNIQLCGVVACTDQNVKSCAKPDVINLAQIDALDLSGNFSSARQVYPTSITKDLQLLPAGSLDLNFYGDGAIGLITSLPLSEALAIGLYGRAYSKDIDGK